MYFSCQAVPQCIFHSFITLLQISIRCLGESLSFWSHPDHANKFRDCCVLPTHWPHRYTTPHQIPELPAVPNMRLMMYNTSYLILTSNSKLNAEHLFYLVVPDEGVLALYRYEDS